MSILKPVEIEHSGNFSYIRFSDKSTGCPKSHYTKVRAYCSACDHLICKITSGMFQKRSSFEEFNGFSEILNERSFFTFFTPLTDQDHIPFELLLFGPTRYEISEKIRALACPLFEISTVKVYVHDVGLCTASTISQSRQLHLTG